MIEAHPRPTNSGRPYSLTSFQSKLDKFQQFIAKETLQDSTATTDEKRQYVNDNLRYEYFCERVRSLFGEDIKSQDLKAIHRKISTNPDARIDWSEVFGYFQAENDIQESGSDEISVFTVSKRKTIGEAAGDKKRRDTIQCVIYSPEFDIYVTASQKGALSLYNGKLRLQNCIDINESAWMTSCQYLPKLRKVIATTERSIIIWDHRAKGQNQSNIHVIKPLEHSPQCMCLVECADEHSDALLIGDDAGYINLIHLTHNDFVIKTSNDQPRVVKYNLIDPTTLTIPIVRRKFHQDWVLQVKYLPDLKSFASCSPGDRTSFVIASMKRMHDTSSVSELSIPRGVNAFCYSEKSNIFATGGVDKTIRIWHPNILSRPTGKMLGHLFTIVDIVMNEKDQHIISLSTARVFRVWDVHTLACLQVFTDSDGRSGERRISAMLFDGRRDRLFTGSSSLDLWPMTRTVQDSMSVPHTHDHPLTTVVLHTSVSHSHVLTVCSESVLKVFSK
uniref:WD repeat-containing protein 64-like n=1 Tax=Ciona intestinalis TaxID=7719 RepID=UPI0005212C2F|nr:WD repeat-containing protein 64-like [Ciona intestinalis]|eukprot:XP_009861346.1 WD repeat-containing protein 64-like [Ciona intestinalis]